MLSSHNKDPHPFDSTYGALPHCPGRVDEALWLVNEGLTLVRLRPGSKKPLAEANQWVTSSDADGVNQWFEDSADVNIGILCSPQTRTVIVDADEYFGRDGSIEGLDLPLTLTSRGRGRQFIYRTDGRPVVTSIPGRPRVQVLGNNHYGACPPSIHPGDPDASQPPFPYTWQHRVPIAQAPAWLYAAAPSQEAPQRPPEAPRTAAKPLHGVQERRKAERLLRDVLAQGPWPQRHRRDFTLALKCVGAGVGETVWSDLVRGLPNSKAREGGETQGARYLERTWRKAQAEAAKRPRTQLPRAALDWQERIVVVRDLKGRQLSVLLALAAMAVSRGSTAVTASNRDLRVLAHVASGSVVAEALDWAIRHKILRQIEPGSDGHAQVVQLLEIPDEMLAGEPWGSGCWVYQGLQDRSGSSSVEWPSPEGEPGRTQAQDHYRRDTPEEESPEQGANCQDQAPSSACPCQGLAVPTRATYQDQVLPTSCSYQGLPILPVLPVLRGAACTTSAATHDLSGSAMGVPPEVPHRWVIRANHPAFLRRALSRSAPLVLGALADGPLRPVDLKKRTPSLGKSTMYRTLTNLSDHSIVSKGPDGRWGIDTLEPLDEIASTYGTDKSPFRLELNNAMERDAYADPSIAPEPSSRPKEVSEEQLEHYRELVRANGLGSVLRRPDNANSLTARRATEAAARADRNQRRRSNRLRHQGKIAEDLQDFD